MSYENVKLWFAKSENEKIVTIDEINDENKNNTYSCPVCGSDLKPKAIKSEQVTSHFAHVDSSKCNSESQIHFWFKHKFIEKGDKFTISADEVKEYVCKDILVEKEYEVDNQVYRPDVTILTECGHTIYFEMAFSNKKKIKDYLDVWLELNNIVVEVDVKRLAAMDKIPTFKSLFYNGKCFNVKKNDTYYNTIGKYKEGKLNGKVDDELRERIRKLDWFWDDVFRYKKGEVDIKHMADLINSIDKKDKSIIDTILLKQSCNKLLIDYKDYCSNLEKERKVNVFNKNKHVIQNGLDVVIAELEKEHEKAFVINYNFDGFENVSLSIKSNLRSNDYVEITHNLNNKFFICGSKVELKKDEISDYIKKCVESEIEKYEIEQLENNNELIESIVMLNEKYQDIDSDYKIEFDYPNLILYYNSNKCMKNNIIKQIEKLKKTDKLFVAFDNKISNYRNKLKIIPNKEMIRESLYSIYQEFKMLRDKMYSNQSYQFIKMEYEFVSEEKLIVWIKNKTSWKYESITINNGKMMVSYIGNRKKQIECDINDTNEIKKILKEQIFDLADEFGVRCEKCHECIDITHDELYAFMKNNNSSSNEILKKVFRYKCEHCKVHNKKLRIAKEIMNAITGNLDEDELGKFKIYIHDKPEEHDVNVDIHDQFTYYSFIVNEDEIILVCESNLYESFSFGINSLEIPIDFILRKINEIKLEHEHTEKFIENIKYTNKVNIRLIDNGYVIPEGVRFKYYKEIKYLDINFISKVLINDINRFKKNHEIVFMFNDKNIDIEYEIDKFKAYGFENTSILENCTKKTRRN